jgi:hypothetical protein
MPNGRAYSAVSSIVVGNNLEGFDRIFELDRGKPQEQRWRIWVFKDAVYHLEGINDMFV